MTCGLRKSESDTLINLFAYGSNMCAERIAARVASARPLCTGYVTHRRLAFHKRGQDGSAKADAFYTGRASDRLWGVVYSLNREELPALDQFEPGYDRNEVTVIGPSGTASAITYVAREEAIDASLQPFSWYHRFVIHGAKQHELPTEYLQYLEAIETIHDSDRERHGRNCELLGELPLNAVEVEGTKT